MSLKLELDLAALMALDSFSRKLSWRLEQSFTEPALPAQAFRTSSLQNHQATSSHQLNFDMTYTQGSLCKTPGGPETQQFPSHRGKLIEGLNSLRAQMTLPDCFDIPTDIKTAGTCKVHPFPSPSFENVDHLPATAITRFRIAFEPYPTRRR